MFLSFKQDQKSWCNFYLVGQLHNLGIQFLQFGVFTEKYAVHHWHLHLVRSVREKIFNSSELFIERRIPIPIEIYGINQHQTSVLIQVFWNETQNILIYTIDK